MEATSLKQILQPDPDCLAVEELGRYGDGVLSEFDKARVEAHLRACANCQVELTLLYAFTDLTVLDHEVDVVNRGVQELRRRSPAAPPREEARRPGRDLWMMMTRWRPVTTMAAVLLSIGAFVYLNHPVAEPVVAGGGPEVTRSAGIVLIAPLGDQAMVPVRLQWQPVSGARTYRVQLSEVDRHELWSSEATTSSIDLPAVARTRIVPGKTVWWQVTAYGPSSVLIAESQLQRFLVGR